MHRTMKVILLLLCLTGIVWADPLEDLKACQTVAQEMAFKVQDIERIRNYYATQGAVLLTQIEALQRELDMIRKELMRKDAK